MLSFPDSTKIQGLDGIFKEFQQKFIFSRAFQVPLKTETKFQEYSRSSTNPVLRALIQKAIKFSNLYLPLAVISFSGKTKPNWGRDFCQNHSGRSVGKKMKIKKYICNLHKSDPCQERNNHSLRKETVFGVF